MTYMHHWYRWWLVAIFTPSYYMNQWWPFVTWMLGINFSEIFIKIQRISIKKMHLLKMSSAKWRPFCLGLDANFLEWWNLYVCDWPAGWENVFEILSTLRLRKMANISQMKLSNAISWMIIYEFRLIVHWSLFLRVQSTIFQHWFR